MHIAPFYSQPWNYHECPKIGTVYNAVMHLQDADEMAESADLDLGTRL